MESAEKPTPLTDFISLLQTLPALARLVLVAPASKAGREVHPWAQAKSGGCNLAIEGDCPGLRRLTPLGIMVSATSLRGTRRGPGVDELPAYASPIQAEG